MRKRLYPEAGDGAGGFDLRATSGNESPGAVKPQSAPTRLSIPLTSDGGIDLSSMRPQTRERLEKAVQGSELLKPEEEPAAVFGPELVPPIYKLLSEIEIPIAVKVLKIPADIACQVFTYSDPEIALLTDPTSKVLSKHGGEFLRKYGEEVALVLLLAALHQQKMFIAVKLKVERAKHEAEKNEKESMEKIKEEFTESVPDGTGSTE